MWRVWAGVVAVVALVGGGYLGWKRYDALRQEKARLELQLAGQKQVNETTAARLATTVVARDSLTAVLDAVKLVNGRLIAALAIRVPARDTVFVHDTIPTVVTQDGSRTATFRDSSWVGVVTGTVDAPPFPRALGITYQVHRPEFRPQIAFAEVDGRGVAIVSWQGERFQVEAPYARPTAVAPPRHVGFILGARYVTPGATMAQAGAWVRGPWGFVALAGAEARVAGSQGVPGQAAFAGVWKVF